MPFVPGLKLARALFEVVEPLLGEAYPGLRYGAGLIGPGSDVLGFDTEMSMDHDWGPRCQLFLDEADAELAPGIVAMLRDRLPREVLGYPTNFASHPGGESVLQDSVPGEPIRHRVAVTALPVYLCEYIGIDLASEWSVADWLSVPSQKLRSLGQAGAVFRQGGGLGEMRRKLAWYPPDVARYLLASSWARIGEDEHLMHRAGVLGDEAGARLLAATLARELMRTVFLMEREYPPYAKWFGTAFARLPAGPELLPLFDGLLEAHGWQAREVAYVAVVEVVAAHQWRTFALPGAPPRARSFHTRPFRVIEGDAIARTILAAIESPGMRELASRRLIGGIDHITSNTNLVSDVARRATLAALYE